MSPNWTSSYCIRPHFTLTEEREKGEEGRRKEIMKEEKTEEKKEEGRKGGNHFNLRMFLMMQ